MGSDGLKKLRIEEVPTVRAIIEERIRQAIVSGVFKPGQRLVERELCEMIGVSRPSVREALRLLEAEGLVRLIPHRGPVVNMVTMEEAKQLYAIRALLEGFAGRECAGRRNTAVLKRLRAAVKQLKTASDTDAEMINLLDIKTEFYSALMDGCCNDFLVKLLIPLHQRITILRATSMSQPGRIRQSLQEITDILSAIEAGDAERAERCCINHVHQAAAAAFESLKRPEANNSEREAHD